MLLQTLLIGMHVDKHPSDYSTTCWCSCALATPPPLDYNVAATAF